MVYLKNYVHSLEKDRCMAKKKPEKIEPPKKDAQPPKKLYLGSFVEEQDMLTFVWLWYSLKPLQAKCKEAIRSTKNTNDLVKKIKQIATDATSSRASFYDFIIEMYESRTDWIAIINKMKEKMASDD